MSNFDITQNGHSCKYRKSLALKIVDFWERSLRFKYSPTTYVGLFAGQRRGNQIPLSTAATTLNTSAHSWLIIRSSPADGDLLDGSPRNHFREFVAELWVEATTSTEPRDVERFGAHHNRELRASLPISLDMQIDLHVVSNDPRVLNRLVPG
jgi:hypothetical protein